MWVVSVGDQCYCYIFIDDNKNMICSSDIILSIVSSVRCPNRLSRPAYKMTVPGLAAFGNDLSAGISSTMISGQQHINIEILSRYGFFCDPCNIRRE
jgi:hypothetical protein